MMLDKKTKEIIRKILLYLITLYVLICFAIDLFYYLQCSFEINCVPNTSNIIKNLLVNIIIGLFAIFIYRSVLIFIEIKGEVNKKKSELKREVVIDSWVDDVKNGKYQIEHKRPPTQKERKMMKLLYTKHGWSKNKIIGVCKGYKGFYGYKDGDVLNWVNNAIM